MYMFQWTVLFCWNLYIYCICGYTYNVQVIDLPNQPIISYLNKNTAFQQSFNPSYVIPCNQTVNPQCTNTKQGIAVRGQNCTAVPGKDTHCEYTPDPADGAPSVVSLLQPKNINDTLFEYMDNSTVIFGPHSKIDIYGTEDPRIMLNPSTGEYHMMYTCVGECGSGYPACPCNQCARSVLLCHAYTKTPFVKDSWIRNGAVFPSKQGSKSGAILIADIDEKLPYKYYLYFIIEQDNNAINIATSNDLFNWTIITDKTLIKPRGGNYFDSQLVESGPPPLRLSSGDYIFFYNGHDNKYEYRAGYLILDGKDPTNVIARSEKPLIDITFPWEKGTPPNLSNVKNVVFLQGATYMNGNEKDIFRVYFGGADCVVGTAIVQVTYS
eukprot:21729_1